MNKRIQVDSPGGIWEGVQDTPGVISFRGIPYAQPPVGKLRWQAPRELQRIEKKYTADSYAPIPFQKQFYSENAYEKNQPPMSEDCLYLNIWASDNEFHKKPVLFWIYGGSYISGYNYIEEYIPENFVKQNPDIIVVAPNYRLGLFASLNLSSMDTTGQYRESNNLALLDQQMAMRWIHNNIQAFGGDPNNVTLFGHSAGSNAITHHLAIKESRQYFSKAICESSFLPDLGYTSLEKSRHISETVRRISNKNSLEELLELSAEQLIDLQEQLFPLSFSGKTSKLFSPVADGIVVSLDPFGEILKGCTAGKTLMIGTSNGEYDQMFLGLEAEETKKAVINLNRDKLEEAPHIVKQYRLIESDVTEKEAYMDLQADFYLRVPGILLAEACCDKSETYVFYYQLYDEERKCRASHGAPNPYIFGTAGSEKTAALISERLMASWAAFVRKGSPNHNDIPEWKTYSHCGRNVMIMDQLWKLEQDFRQEQYELLSPFFEEGRKLKERFTG